MKKDELLLTVFIFFQFLLLFPGILSIKRLITQNKKKIDKSYHNLFYFCIFVGTWGLFFTVVYYEVNDQKMELTIVYWVFISLIFYGVCILIVIQANLFYNCKFQDEKKANKKTKKVLICITTIFVLLLALHFIKTMKMSKTTKLYLNLAQDVITIFPIALTFYYYFKVRSFIKSISYELVTKQIQKLFWVVVVYSLLILLEYIFFLIEHWQGLPLVWEIIYLMILFLLNTIPPFLIIISVFKPANYNSDQLVPIENSSDVDLEEMEIEN
ncbi:hypothetical protein M0812_15773 [Anaeramoeba flamelloides]|uniref:THH1/TOM1/TOM3 domain-containing protein n=1 Tax=Anaeramoeba flamelloides TaxID=1746091 RepID=A0AAV7ZIU1_9EUKA|nr:hypothetical protein M0812_15773 [Anaeramoeba flamelloides]